MGYFDTFARVNGVMRIVSFLIGTAIIAWFFYGATLPARKHAEFAEMAEKASAEAKSSRHQMVREYDLKQGGWGSEAAADTEFGFGRDNSSATYRQRNDFGKPMTSTYGREQGGWGAE